MEKEKVSFIPKKSFYGPDSKPAYAYRRAGAGLAMKISLLLFISSLVIFGGALFYKRTVTQQINDLSVSLGRAKAAFDTAVIFEMEKMSSNIFTAKNLLAEHYLSSGLLDMIEELTHKKIGFSNFSYTYNPLSTQNKLSQPKEKENMVKILLKGEAEDYVSLSQQSKILEESEKVENFFFSNFSLTQEGHISFAIEIAVDPSNLFLSL